jgi:phosphate transport system protein
MEPAVPPTAHTHKVFDDDLEALRTRILGMGGTVEYQIRYAMEALRTGARDAAEKVMVDEVRVNEMERDIDAQLSQVLAKRFPAAVDLRFVMAAMKIVTDLERIGDEAKKIALVAQRLAARDRMRRGQTEIQALAEQALAMIRRALDAFARREAAEAVEIQKQDTHLDERFQAILRQLLTYMIEDPRTITPALELVFVAKSLERVGDHAKNISEQVVYVVLGHDVRHVTPADLERAVGR